MLSSSNTNSINIAKGNTKKVDSNLVLKTQQLNVQTVDENGNPECEPLLVENPMRFVMFPIQIYDIWEAYKTMEANFWSAEDIELFDDTETFPRLAPAEKRIILVILRAMSVIDILTGSTGLENLSDEVQIPEARCFYGYQMMQKNIHLELVSLFLQAFGPEYSENKADIDKIRFSEALGVRKQWVDAHLADSSKPFVERVAALAISSYLFLSGAIAVILHLEKTRIDAATRETPGKSKLYTSKTADDAAHMFDKSILPGLVRGIHKICSDMASYCSFNFTVYSHIINQINPRTFSDMLKSAVQSEKMFTAMLLDTAGVGESGALNGGVFAAADVEKHIEYVAGQIARGFGMATDFAPESPFTFMYSILPKLSFGSYGKVATTPASMRSNQMANASPAGGFMSSPMSSDLLTSPLKSPSAGVATDFSMDEDF